MNRDTSYGICLNDEVALRFDCYFATTRSMYLSSVDIPDLPNRFDCLGLRGTRRTGFQILHTYYYNILMMIGMT